MTRMNEHAEAMRCQLTTIIMIKFGPVAQLGERNVGNVEVVGSIPIRSTHMGLSSNGRTSRSHREDRGSNPLSSTDGPIRGKPA